MGIAGGLTPAWHRLLVPALPAVAAVVLYLPGLAGGFLGDDYSMLLGAEALRTASDPWSRIAALFTHGIGAASNQYRPLAQLSFLASDVLSGAHAPGWRAWNIALHAANAALVAVLARRLYGPATWATSMAAIAAGLLFAAFPPSVEAVAWISGRFDGLVTFFMLVAAGAFLRSQRWRDGAGLLALAATVCALLCKESAAIVPVLIVALAWWRQPAGLAWRTQLATTCTRSLPWVLLTMAYLLLRVALFGDPLRVFSYSAPFDTLASGGWLDNALSFAAWWTHALPQAVPRALLGGAQAALALAAVAIALREPGLRRTVVACALAAAGAAALLMLQVYWRSNGEGGRSLYQVAAIVAIALAAPLCARSRAVRAWACLFAVVAVAASLALQHTVLQHRTSAGLQMQALARDVALIAARTGPDGYALVVVPDRNGMVPFGRGSQGGLVLPPVQEAPLSARVLVQTTYDLPALPDLLRRDLVGRLRRERLADLVAHLDHPLVAPAALPDRYFCYDMHRGVTVPLRLVFAPDLSDWDVRWREALAASGCALDENTGTVR